MPIAARSCRERTDLNKRMRRLNRELRKELGLTWPHRPWRAVVKDRVLEAIGTCYFIDIPCLSAGRRVTLGRLRWKGFRCGRDYGGLIVTLLPRRRR